MDEIRTVEPRSGRKERGQALVEYALILAFVVMALIAILAITGPAVGNIFSNVVYNLIGKMPDDVVLLDTLGGASGDFWATVTWVANNPQRETPYPTPLDLPTDDAPTPFQSYTFSQTPTSSNTATQTNTRTPTNTPTTTATWTAGPSPTPEDKEFLVPFADRADEVLDWRLDRSYVLSPGNWNVDYYNGASCTGTPVSTTTTWINVDWGAGSPDVAINPDNFIACWSKNFTLAQNTPLEFLAENLAGGTMVVTLDGSTTVLNASATGNSNSYTVPAGSHTITVTYAHGSGNAAVALLIERPSQNPSDAVPTGVNGCPWATTNDNVLSGSPMNVFDDDPITTSWPAGQRCFLELRGWINSASAANPRLSFWDVWNFAGASGIAAVLEIANYVESSPGVLDRTVWNTPLYSAPVRSTGTANYNWTRTEVDLTTIGGLSSRWTFRFVLGNTSGSAQTIHWYIDDVQVLNEPTPSKTFTVNNEWNLNARSQMADFIFNADANYTLEQTTASPPGNEWRWNIASDFARSGTAFVLKDYAPSAATSGGPLTERLYYLEFRYPINLSASTAPGTDFDGDTGLPILSIWQAYQLTAGASVAVEYNTSGTWQPLTAVEAPLPGSPVTPMIPSTYALSTIAGWDTAPFRLRFRLTINQSATVNAGDGWFLDDIKIERDQDSPYAPYTFYDSAESASDAAKYWVGTGLWARTSQTGGAQGGGFNYSDSPGAGVNYPPDPPLPATNQTYLEMRRMIDLLGDTPSAPAHAAANRPTLTFWMHRDIQGEFDVEIWTEATDAWTTAWSMDNATRSTNTAWERVEIDIQDAVDDNSPSTWATIASNGIQNDDDIKIRFRLDGAGAVGYDGVYVDEINIGNLSEVVHVLSDPGTEYTDSIEVEVPSSGLAIDERWYLGGLWNTYGGQGYLNTLGLSDSPGFTHDEDWLAMAEMATIFDLSNSLADNYPSLDFRIRYNIASFDNLRVQIAQEQVGDPGPQVYGDMLGWGPWTDAPLTIAGGATSVNGRVETLLNGHVNLTPYLNRRIRIRFVLQTIDDLTTTNGVTLDNVGLSYHPTSETTPAPWSGWTNLADWTSEGSWGSTDEFFTAADTGGSLGGQWYGLFFDCETLYPTSNCDIQPTYNTMLTTDYPAITYDPTTFCPSGTAGIVCQDPQPQADLNLWIADGGKPNGVGDEYIDTYGARWARDLTFAQNTTYTVYAISNEGMRLTIDSTLDLIQPTSTTIINSWFPHSNQLDVATIQTGAITGNRRLTVDFFDVGGSGVMSLSITTTRFSFSDSPNTASGGGSYTEVSATRWGNSSLMYNKFISTPGGGATLRYSLMWELVTNNTIYVEVSYDGGFTWSIVETLPGGLPRDNHPPNGTWVTSSAALAGSQSAVTFRFRLDTIANGDNPNLDGMWISDVNVTVP